MSDPNVSIIQPKGRGAPNGNKNAMRHGFYAKNLGLTSPSKLDEFELRNLMGEVAMSRSLHPRGAFARGVKDYMHILYTKNLASDDPIVLTETLRALSLAGMAVSRLLLVHCQVRITRSGSASSLNDLLADMGDAASRANRLSSSVSSSLVDGDDL